MAEKRQSQDKSAVMETAIKETVKNFQNELNGMLTQVTNTMGDLKKSGLTNGNQLKAEYGKGEVDCSCISGLKNPPTRPDSPAFDLFNNNYSFSFTL